MFPFLHSFYYTENSNSSSMPMKLPQLSYRSLLTSPLLFFIVFMCSTTLVFAARTINSATLNGAASVTVSPSESITASVTVTTDGSGANNDWQSTGWQISGQSVNCIDHTDYSSSGTFSENFTVTAPGSNGTYTISFIAYRDNACSTSASNTYTITNGITVASPTSTPTPVPTATQTPTPPPGATSTPTAPPGSTATPTFQQESTVTSTPTPTSTTSGSSTSSVTYYPSVSLNAYSPNPTNNTSLSYTGTVSIESGAVKIVEYSITEGAEWLSVSLNSNSFSFTTPPLSEGAHTILVRAQSTADVFTQPGSYASDRVTIITTPPQITLNAFEKNPTNDTSPTLTGTASSPRGTIVRVEVTLDGGVSWIQATFSDGTFTFTTEPLEDNNYTISARAIDNAGNSSVSPEQTLIVDTLPPIIGGAAQSVGPQILSPHSSGIVTVVAGAKTTMAMSMKGGVTKAEIVTNDGSFPLSMQPDTNRWVGTVQFASAGDKQLSVSATDGAGNKTTRLFSTMHVEPFGTLMDAQTNAPILDASITLYVFETSTHGWTMWDGLSYGQENPQQTSDGTYSFLLPAGTYYLDVTAAGYRHVQSGELTLLEPSIINGVLPMRPSPTIRFTVPVFGPLVFSIPSFFQSPDSVSPNVFGANHMPTAVSVNAIKNTRVPAFSLPDLSGNTISPDQFAGKRWILSFFSPWSPLSQEQAPLLSRLSGMLADDQNMLVISLQETSATTQTFMKKGRYDFPTVVDTNGDTAALFALSVLPQHVFIDTEGIIREVYTGVLTEEELLDKLSKVP